MMSRKLRCLISFFLCGFLFIAWPSSLMAASVTVSPTAVERGEDVRATWSGFSGNVNVAVYKGSTFWVYANTNVARSSYQDLDTSGWDLRSDYRVKVELRSNPSIYQYSSYFSITAPPSLTVTYPNGGEVWGVGDSKTIQWSHTGTFSSFTIQISRDGGSTWSNIESGLPGDYTYRDWTVTAPGSSICRIKVIGYYTGGSTSDISNSNFIIGQLMVTSPNGGETWQAGTSQNITWTSSNVTGNILIQPYRGESPQTPITTSAPNTESYTWDIPQDYTPGTTYKIGISAMSGNVSDFSDSYFTIQESEPGLTISAQQGWTIFTPSGPCESPSDSEYRYGPSIIINEDKSIDVWFSSPGDGGGQWDWIRYNRSTDGGVTWEYSWEPHTNPAGPDVVLVPSDPPSLDQYSSCDPGVIKFGGYYYIGYTSAGNDIGKCNNVFVARSTSPTGPFQKWNGSGWGGDDPQPFIEWPCVDPNEWGASEPSFVVKDETLYIYYEWTDVGTKVAMTSTLDPDWPGNITFYGEPAIPKVLGEDSRDVKYIDELGLFVAVAVGDRFSNDSFVHVWESTDGLSFISADEIRDNLVAEAHNVGISGTPEGHIDRSFDNFIAYGYGPPPLPDVSECWPTYLNPISIHSLAEWTFFVYLGADNSLSFFANADLEEMQQVGSDSNVNVVTLVDQIGDHDTHFYKVEHGSLIETALSEINPGWIDEVDMSDPSTLVTSANYVIDNYPANRYCIVLWNHGDGWKKEPKKLVYRAVIEDKGNIMRMDDVGHTLRDIKAHLGSEIDLVGFDACLMEMIEVAYEIRDHAKVMVGSEDLIGAEGWPYDTILEDLVNDPAMDSETFARNTVDRYAELCDGTPYWTLSALRLNMAYDLAMLIDDFADSLTSNWDEIRLARSSSQEFVFWYDPDFHEHIDLYDFCVELDTAEAQAVMGKVDDMVINERHGSGLPDSHGLAIYFPANGDDYDSEYHASPDHQIMFPVDTSWDEFLARYYEPLPPTPNPMTWATAPNETSTSSISMVATTASDPTPPITYYFDFYSSPTSGSGGNDSSWQSSTSYTDSGLGTNHQYGYRVRARDGNDNRNTYSDVSYDFTDIEMPSGITFGAITNNSIQAKSINTPSGLTRGSSGLRIYNITKGTDSGWTQNNNYWTSGSLSVNTLYGFRAKARNGDADETGYCSTSYHYTLANAPGTSSFTNVTQTSIQANWTANGNPSGTEYYCENTTAGANSGWTTNTYWNTAGLTCGTFYTFRVTARNGNGTQTGWTNLGSQSTQPCSSTPTVTTTAVSSITSNSAFSGGNVTNDGGAAVTARGVCWSTSANPTTSDSHTTDGTGTGSFTSSITGLSPNTTYHVSAYATNSVGTGYGSDQTFTTKGDGGKAMPWLQLLLLDD